MTARLPVCPLLRQSSRRRRLTAPAGREGVWLRILAKLVFTGDCWLWQGADCGGSRRGCPERRYGKIWVLGRIEYVHRVVYEIFHGPIPAGWSIDHTHDCHTGLCVNPLYLEAVPPRINHLRAAGLTNCGDRYAYEGDVEYDGGF